MAARRQLDGGAEEAGQIEEAADASYAIRMTVTLTILDSISAALMEKFSDPGRAALEALAAKA